MTKHFMACEESPDIKQFSYVQDFLKSLPHICSIMLMARDFEAMIYVPPHVDEHMGLCKENNSRHILGKKVMSTTMNLHTKKSLAKYSLDVRKHRDKIN